MPKATVLIPAFHHRSNLLRCLDAWRRQTVLPDQLIVIDDGGNEDLYLTLPESEHVISTGRGQSLQWRSMNGAVRSAWPLVKHDFIILCSCDLLFPSFALEGMMEAQVENQRSVATVYGLNRQTTAIIDELPWRETECEVFEQQPDFWKTGNNFGSDNMRAAEWRHHTLFNANTRKGWEQFEPLAFPDREDRSGDMDWLRQAEVDAGRPITTLPFAVYHQWHPGKFVDLLTYDIAREDPLASARDPAFPTMSVRLARMTGKNRD